MIESEFGVLDVALEIGIPIAHVILVRASVLFTPTLQIFSVPLQGLQIARRELGVEYVLETEKLEVFGQIRDRYIRLALADHEVDHDERFVHHCPRCVLHTRVERPYNLVEFLWVASAQQDGVHILGLGGRHLDLCGALDQFYICCHVNERCSSAHS